MWANGDRPTPLTSTNRNPFFISRSSRDCRPAEYDLVLHVDKPGKLPLSLAALERAVGGAAGRHWHREAEAETEDAEVERVSPHRFHFFVISSLVRTSSPWFIHLALFQIE